MPYPVPHFISRIGSVGNNTFLPVMSGFAVASVATESLAQVEMTFSGTFSDFESSTRVANGTGTTTYTLRKNGAGTAITWTVPQSATGQHGDAVDTVTFVSGDVFSIGITTSAGSPTELTGISFKIESDDGETRRVIGTYINSGIAFSTLPRFLRPEGELANNLNTESTTQALVHNDSVIEALSVNVTANTRTLAGTIVPRINGVSGALSLSITASTTGRFTVSGGTDAVVVDDLLNTQFSAGGSGSISINYVAMTIKSDNPREISLMHGNNISAPTADTANDFNMIGNRMSTSPTEGAYQVRLKSGGVLSRFTINTSANGANVGLISTVRINGADGNQTTTIPASTAGTFTDTTNSDTIDDNDAVGFRNARPSTGTGTTTLRNTSALFVMDELPTLRIFMS